MTSIREFAEVRDTLRIYSLIVERDLGFFQTLFRCFSPRKRSSFQAFMRRFREEIQDASTLLEWHWAEQGKDFWQGLKKSLDRAEGIYKRAGGK